MSKTHKDYKEIGYLEDQTEFFDKLITQDWDTYQDQSWNAKRKFEVQSILRSTPKVRRVLDVGCGSGYHDMLFANYTSIEQVVGIDPSVKSIERAQTTYSSAKINRLVTDIFNPGDTLKDLGLFDLVVSFQVIEHVSRPIEFLAQCIEFTATPGFIAVVTPNRRRLENRLRLGLGMSERKIDPMHYAEYSHKEMEKMGESLGLKLIACFSHTISFGSKSFTLLNGNSILGLNLGRFFPAIANVMGLVFKNNLQ